MASPEKRRVLAPLDTNATMLAPSPSVLLPPAPVKAMSADSSSSSRPAAAPAVAPASRTLFPPSPPSSSSPFSSSSARVAVASPSAAKKRPRDEDSGSGSGIDGCGQDTPAADTAAPWKKTSTSTGTSASCPDHTYSTHPSLSPAPSSSVFDVSSGSLVDPSQATNITEPDLIVPPPVYNASRVLLTREQSRQKAEILKLRLSLARYKLRTGQVDVPLEQLRVVPPSVVRRSAANDNSPFARVPLTLPSLSSSLVEEERRDSGEGIASEWVRKQQQRREQQPQLPQQPLPHKYRSRSSSQCSSRSSSCDSISSSSSSRGGRQANADERRGETTMKDVDDDDAEDSAQRQEDEEDAEFVQEEAENACKGLQLVTPRPSRRPQLVDDDLSDDDRGHGRAAERLTSSVMRGNAVSGLLSLARS